MTTMQPKIVKDEAKKTRELIKPGSYPARIYSIVVLGTVKDVWKGVEKEVEKVNITFELPTQLKVFKEENGPEPRVISQSYNISLFEKAGFRQLIDATGMEIPKNANGVLQFNIWDLVGRTCLLSIGKKVSEKTGNEYNEINSYALMIDGMTIPDQMNKTITYDVSQHDQILFSKFPEFLQKKIVESKEYQLLVAGAAISDAQELPDLGDPKEEPVPLDFDTIVNE